MDDSRVEESKLRESVNPLPFHFLFESLSSISGATENLDLESDCHSPLQHKAKGRRKFKLDCLARFRRRHRGEEEIALFVLSCKLRGKSAHSDQEKGRKWNVTLPLRSCLAGGA